ncbi:MAG: M16 family metallopeptidase [Ignavibacteria bacterium]
MNGSHAANDVLFSEFDLTNGLKVILSADSSIPSAAINLCYHVGSKDDDPDKRGFSHLFEHLMFEGSKNIAPGDYDRLSLMAGCENNAYTTEDKTNYYLLVPSNQIEFGLWLESDRMLEFAVTEESLELQKEVVIEEKKQVYDNKPYGSVSMELAPRLFSENGYGWDTIGNTVDIENAKLDDVRAFFGKYYVPNNAVLTIAGDIDIDKTIRLVERYFGPISKGQNGSRKEFQNSLLEKEVRAEIYDEIQLPGIFLAYKMPKEDSKEFFEFDILSDVLSMGDSSRLYKELVYDKHLVSDVGAWVEGKEFAGLINIYAILMPGVKIETVQNEIDRIISEVKDGKVTAAELEKVINRIETRHAYRMQTNLSKADMLSHYAAFYNDPGLINTNIERYHMVTLEGIRESAAKYLDPANRVVLNYLPKK